MDPSRGRKLQANWLDHYIARLVRVRLFYLFLQHLLFQMGGHHPGKGRATVEVVWPEHRDLPLLPSRFVRWSFC